MKKLQTHSLLWLSIVGLLGTGCAQWQKSWQNPNQYTQNFEHMLLTQETAQYPTLGPAAAAKEYREPTLVANNEITRPHAPKANAVYGFQHVSPPKGSSQHAVNGRVLVPVTPLIEATDRPTVAGRTDIKETPKPMVASAPMTQPTTKPKAGTTEKTPAVTAPTIVATESTGTPETMILSENSPNPVAGLGDGSITSEILAAAKRTVGIENDLDPEGFATHLVQVNDLDIPTNGRQSVVKAVYEHLNQTNQLLEGSVTPLPGDLVFFHNTYDRDQDQRADDWFTLLGVVERVDGDGTVQFISFFAGKIQRLYLNLDRPSTANAELADKVLNSPLRERKLSDRPYTSYLSGELFASFGRIR